MFGQGSVQKVLSEYTEEESYQETKAHELQAFLEAKSDEIAKLHRCFSQATRQLLNYQRREQILKRTLNHVLQQCKFLHDQSRLMGQELQKFRRWKRFEEDKIRSLPEVISSIMKENKQMLMVRFKEQMEAVSKRYQFELVRIEQAQKTQIDILKAEFEDKLKSSRDTIFLLEAEVSRLKTLQSSSVNSCIEQSICKITPLKQKNKFDSNDLNQRIQTKYQGQSRVENSPMSLRKPFHAIPVTPTLSKKNMDVSISNENIQQENIMSRSRPSSIRKHQQSGNFASSALPLIPNFQNYYQNKHDPRTNGFSTLIINGRQIYRGLWKEGKFHGRGKLTTDVFTYDGQFKNGIADGLGNIYFGRNTFIGRFSNGHAEGEGTLITPQGQASGIWNKNYLVQLL